MAIAQPPQERPLLDQAQGLMLVRSRADFDVLDKRVATGTTLKALGNHAVCTGPLLTGSGTHDWPPHGGLI